MSSLPGLPVVSRPLPGTLGGLRAVTSYGSLQKSGEGFGASLKGLHTDAKLFALPIPPLVSNLAPCKDASWHQRLHSRSDKEPGVIRLSLPGHWCHLVLTGECRLVIYNKHKLLLAVLISALTHERPFHGPSLDPGGRSFNSSPPSMWTEDQPVCQPKCESNT